HLTPDTYSSFQLFDEVARYRVADASVQLVALFERDAGGRDGLADDQAHAAAGANDRAAARQELARAADAHRGDRQPGADRQADAALLELVDLAVAAAGALGVEEDAEALRRARRSGVDLLDRRLRVVAIDDDVIADRQRLAEERQLEQLLLGDEVHRE